MAHWSREYAPEDAEASDAMRCYAKILEEEWEQREAECSSLLYAVRRCKFCGEHGEIHYSNIDGIPTLRCIVCDATVVDCDGHLKWTKSEENEGNNSEMGSFCQN